MPFALFVLGLPVAPLTLGAVVAHAAPLLQLVMAALALATIAAVAIAAIKLAGRRLDGGSAFLSGLRLGGPLTGALGAAFSGFRMSLGLTTVAPQTPLSVLAPGFAEMTLLLCLGLFAGAVAVIGCWAIEARIDRAVLSA
jgi:hypothetical protein